MISSSRKKEHAGKASAVSTDELVKMRGARFSIANASYAQNKYTMQSNNGLAKQNEGTNTLRPGRVETKVGAKFAPGQSIRRPAVTACKRHGSLNNCGVLRRTACTLNKRVQLIVAAWEHTRFFSSHNTSPAGVKVLVRERDARFPR